ncbi:MAG: DsbA family protein [Longimicrobiales bacterium]|nr:DsbA family protein [Longimicrobiales bacterium]
MTVVAATLLAQRMTGIYVIPIGRPAVELHNLAIHNGWSDSSSACQGDTLCVGIVFDYTCTHCSQLSDDLAPLIAEVETPIRIRWYDYPGSSALSWELHLAGRCAEAVDGVHGGREELFAVGRARVAQVDWKGVANGLGISNVESFENCIRSGEYQSSIEADVGFGQQIGVRGTPFIIVNGHGILGYPGFDPFVRTLRRLAGE